ncbi:hypothetical protein T05_15519 [Trichinella murrelli]|uniref:Uncharacterized protein n=1 Tax=Trichinella murrelli TaxID=144512 RepID=A0A0V0TH73_9BILA|nr:hypothetical protein T05_15519 [Trichinella murrelli]
MVKLKFGFNEDSYFRKETFVYIHHAAQRLITSEWLQNVTLQNRQRRRKSSSMWIILKSYEIFSKRILWLLKNYTFIKATCLWVERQDKKIQRKYCFWIVDCKDKQAMV